MESAGENLVGDGYTELAYESVRNRRGIRLVVDPKDARGQFLLNKNGNGNPDSMLIWDILINAYSWSMVVDVGANYGEMLAGVKLPAGAKVFAFEPNNSILPYLRTNLGQISPSVEVRPKALAGWRGTGELAISAEWSGTSHLASGESKSEILEPVTVSTITNEFADIEIDSMCIKIDVEGGEIAVLKGAGELLDRVPKWGVMLEVLHLEESQVQEALQDNLFYALDVSKRRMRRIGFLGTDWSPSTFANDPTLYKQDVVMVSGQLSKLSQSRVGRKLRQLSSRWG